LAVGVGVEGAEAAGVAVEAEELLSEATVVELEPESLPPAGLAEEE